MAKDIVRGMTHLHSENILVSFLRIFTEISKHRDLAARNMLVDKKTKYVIKVSDFGMASQTDSGMTEYINDLTNLRNLFCKWFQIFPCQMEVSDNTNWQLTMTVHLKWWHTEFIARSPMYGPSELYYGRLLREKIPTWEWQTPKSLKKFKRVTDSLNRICVAIACIRESCWDVGMLVEFFFNLCNP